MYIYIYIYIYSGPDRTPERAGFQKPRACIPATAMFQPSVSHTLSY